MKKASRYNLLFLYSELAGYFLSSVRALQHEFNAEAHIVHWPVNPEAPFDLSSFSGLNFYERKQMNAESIKTLIRNLQPDAVVVSGWMDKAYLQALPGLKNQIPVVCAIDNQWSGSARQRAAALYARLAILPRFSHAWVAGIRQYEFARRLGFAADHIKTGFYSADTSAFGAVAEIRPPSDPKAFLYVGRFYDFKGIPELLMAFQKFKADFPEWKLILTGKGDLPGWARHDPQVIIRPFTQPDELPRLALEASCFVLPSRKEPWGVVLHEFAAAGLPLIASDVTGASTAFLADRYNGLINQAGNADDLFRKMTAFALLPEETRHLWGQRSRELALQITPQKWASTLISLIKEKQ